MKYVLKFVACSLIIGIIFFASCKKDNYVPPVVIAPPAGANNQQPMPLGTLSIPREDVCAATAGNKILFAGGATQTGPSPIASSRVDIYDTTTHRWSTAELSMPRAGLIATSLGNKIYFVDGYINNSSRIDIYDAAANTWSTAELNTGRAGLASGSVGKKIAFAGGYTPYGDKIDILDTSANTWSTAILSEPRAGISATSIQNKIFFSGGIQNSGDLSNKVDIYDAVSNVWSTITMSEPRYYHKSIAAANQIFWAGGCSSFDSDGELISNNTVEIYNVNTGGRVHHQLTHNPFYATVINNTVVFFSVLLGSSNSIDVYDMNTQAWSVRDIYFSVPTVVGSSRSIVASGNKIFIAEGLNGSKSSEVWKLEF